jgi:hypothetical protein
VGGGFVWRQIGRGLIGLVPVWGIVPKVGIAYAGTFATGQAIYRWCAYGEKLSAAALNKLYSEATERGKQLAQSLLELRKKPPEQVPGESKPRWKLAWPRLPALPKLLRRGQDDKSK